MIICCLALSTYPQTLTDRATFAKKSLLRPCKQASRHVGLFCIFAAE